MKVKIIIIALITTLLLSSTTAYAEGGHKQKKKMAYLTFDDGPSKNTDKILDILKKYKVHATFFVNGRPERINTYKRIINEGNAIGNHTYSHNYQRIYISEKGFINDLIKLDDFLSNIGIKTSMVRFPGGSINHVSLKFGGRGIMRALTKDVTRKNLWYCDWNVDSKDSEKTLQPTKVIIDNVLSQSKHKKRVIILMHDAPVKVTTPLALPCIINGLKRQGFEFGVLSTEVKPMKFKK